MNPRTPVLVAALVGAVVLGAGGQSVAGSLITGKDVKNNSLTGKDVKDGSLQSADLSKAAVTALRGPAGPAGAAGANGLAGLQTVTSSLAVGGSTGGRASVECPAGKVAVSGGGGGPFTSQPSKLVITYSGIINPTTYVLEMTTRDDSATPAGTKMSLYVVCASGS